MHGQVRQVNPDLSTDDVNEHGNPPLVISVSEVKEDEIRKVQYLRRPHKEGNSWHYVFVRPAEA